jgi:arabinofuranosyltransferase
LGQYWPLLPATLLYGLLANRLNFTQDDAYISYRYVANFLNGHGLVFNIGERIEGFTNLGWTIIMILFGSLGLDFILISKLMGFLFGGGLIVLTFLIARRVFGEGGFWLAAASAMLAGANQSLAYWAPAGLETAAFGFLAVWALHLYLKRSWLLIFALVLAVWTRPEGAVVTGILIVVELAETRRLPRFTLISALVAFVLSLPMIGFKLAYYGSILPNPFYAKTSFSLEQLIDGATYAGGFMADYGLWGFGLLAPLIFLKRLSREVRAVWMFTALYCLYVVGIGGDVLKVHRFFVPVFGPSAILLMVALWLIVSRLRTALSSIAMVIAFAGLLTLTCLMPRAEVEHYNRYERRFVHKMAFRAKALRESDPTNFSVAVPTIGVFGYELLGHNVIDMLGLTDSTIARHPEDPIPGMETTWRERKHNTRYILGKAPDYIVFSTDLKPSAPAERALLLYRQFQDCYRTICWFYGAERSDGRGLLSVLYKKRKPVEGELVPVYPVEFVNEYKLALDAYSVADFPRALEGYNRALRASPTPYYIYLVYQRAYALMRMGEYDVAKAIMDSVVARDSTVFEPHVQLFRAALYERNLQRALIHQRWLQTLVPWYWPRVEAQAIEDIKAQTGK